MDLGAFTVSLSVKDIHASFDFYSKLGFTIQGGDIKENWVVLKNGHAVIGLFQGMFPKNILTFIPGWDQEGKEVAKYTDVRQLQKELKAKGIKLATEADEGGAGPANFTMTDPDGNEILFDQYR